MVSIVDNFLEAEDFKNVQSYLLSAICFWQYVDHVDNYEYRNELDTFQFVHGFYNMPILWKDIERLESIIKKIDPVAVYRIKANLIPKTSDIIENSLHVDIIELVDSSEKLKQWTTSIYYVNTNDGYTKFETGEIVESVGNRMVTFPSNILHTGTSCTDEKVRVVINFDYFSK